MTHFSQKYSLDTPIACFEGKIRGTCCEFDTLKPRQNDLHFADGIVKYIFFNENVWTTIEFLLKLVPKDGITNKSALVQMMAWHWIGNTPLSEPKVTHFNDAFMSMS